MDGKMSAEQCKRIVENVWEIESSEVARLREIDSEIMYRLVRMIGDCQGRIFTTGCGTSGVAAKKVAHTLCCVERPTCFCPPSDAVHGEMGCLRKGDIMIMFSKGGNTQELVNMIGACETKGVTIIAVTENGDSILAQHAQLWVPIHVEKEPDPFNMMATASILATISYFDALCIALVEYTGYTKEQFLVIHPGGAVGERLLKEQKGE